jgi:hypothetical protein
VEGYEGQLRHAGCLYQLPLRRDHHVSPAARGARCCVGVRDGGLRQGAEHLEACGRVVPHLHQAQTRQVQFVLCSRREDAGQHFSKRPYAHRRDSPAAALMGTESTLLTKIVDLGVSTPRFMSQSRVCSLFLHAIPVPHTSFPLSQIHFSSHLTLVPIRGS